MKPHTCVLFDECMTKLDKCEFLTAETFLDKNCNVWCYTRILEMTSVRKQHQVLRNINEIYRNLTSDEKVWTKHNIIILLILYILKTFSYCVLVIFLQRRSHILLHGWKKISLTKQQRPQKTHRVLTTCVLGNQLNSRKGIIRKYMIHPRRRSF